MAGAALIVCLGGFLVCVGLRSWLHQRATGDTGHRHRQSRIGSPAWWSMLAFTVAGLLSLFAPILALTGVLAPPQALDRTPLGVAGLITAIAGFIGVSAAQSAMGRSWRTGVDPTEHTELVTTGVFGIVRNPVYTAVLAATAGLTLMVPTWAQLLALISWITAVQLQVRGVEEPHLTQTHGTAYTDYATCVGRFLPHIGVRPHAWRR
jgi:protein-S-isoprenylcysteine O-methyltransferase Ste14